MLCGRVFVTIMITQLLQVFESHGGLLSAESFTTYCSPYLSQIAQRVKENLTKNNLPIVPMVQLLLMYIVNCMVYFV